MTDPETSRHVEIKDDDGRTADVAEVTTARGPDGTGATPPDKSVSTHARLEVNYRPAESFGHIRNFSTAVPDSDRRHVGESRTQGETTGQIFGSKHFRKLLTAECDLLKLTPSVSKAADQAPTGLLLLSPHGDLSKEVP
jgi:hypothetical protein